MLGENNLVSTTELDDNSVLELETVKHPSNAFFIGNNPSDSEKNFLLFKNNKKVQSMAILIFQKAINNILKIIAHNELGDENPDGKKAELLMKDYAGDSDFNWLSIEYIHNDNSIRNSLKNSTGQFEQILSPYPDKDSGIYLLSSRILCEIILYVLIDEAEYYVNNYYKIYQQKHTIQFDTKNVLTECSNDLCHPVDNEVAVEQLLTTKSEIKNTQNQIKESTIASINAKVGCMHESVYAEIFNDSEHQAFLKTLQCFKINLNQESCDKFFTNELRKMIHVYLDDEINLVSKEQKFNLIFDNFANSIDTCGPFVDGYNIYDVCISSFHKSVISNCVLPNKYQLLIDESCASILDYFLQTTLKNECYYILSILMEQTIKRTVDGLSQIVMNECNGDLIASNSWNDYSNQMPMTMTKCNSNQFEKISVNEIDEIILQMVIEYGMLDFIAQLSQDNKQFCLSIPQVDNLNIENPIPNICSISNSKKLKPSSSQLNKGSKMSLVEESITENLLNIYAKLNQTLQHKTQGVNNKHVSDIVDNNNAVKDEINVSANQCKIPAFTISDLQLIKSMHEIVLQNKKVILCLSDDLSNMLNLPNTISQQSSANVFKPSIDFNSKQQKDLYLTKVNSIIKDNSMGDEVVSINNNIGTLEDTTETCTSILNIKSDQIYSKANTIYSQFVVQNCETVDNISDYDDCKLMTTSASVCSVVRQEENIVLELNVQSQPHQELMINYMPINIKTIDEERFKQTKIIFDEAIYQARQKIRDNLKVYSNVSCVLDRCDNNDKVYLLNYDNQYKVLDFDPVSTLQVAENFPNARLPNVNTVKQPYFLKWDFVKKNLRLFKHWQKITLPSDCISQVELGNQNISQFSDSQNKDNLYIETFIPQTLNAIENETTNLYDKQFLNARISKWHLVKKNLHILIHTANVADVEYCNTDTEMENTKYCGAESVYKFQPTAYPTATESMLPKYDLKRHMENVINFKNQNFCEIRKNLQIATSLSRWDIVKKNLRVIIMSAAHTRKPESRWKMVKKNLRSIIENDKICQCDTNFLYDVKTPDFSAAVLEMDIMLKVDKNNAIQEDHYDYKYCLAFDSNGASPIGPYIDCGFDEHLFSTEKLLSDRFDLRSFENDSMMMEKITLGHYPTQNYYCEKTSLITDAGFPQCTEMDDATANNSISCNADGFSYCHVQIEPKPIESSSIDANKSTEIKRKFNLSKLLIGRRNNKELIENHKLIPDTNESQQKISQEKCDSRNKISEIIEVMNGDPNLFTENKKLSSERCQIL